VVKLGGAAGNALEPALADLALRSDYVVVHGGSDEVDRLSGALGQAPVFYTSPSGVVSRKSDAAYLDVLVLALAGKVQTAIVTGFARRGVRAVGLSGADAGLLRARRKEGIRAVVGGKTLRVTDDWSGTLEAADPRFLRLLLENGFVPVVGPPALTADGDLVNVDADRVAAAVAVAIGASDLLLLTNVPGLLRDVRDPESVIPTVERSSLEEIRPLATGRMRKKIVAAQEALAGGVPRVVIASSSVDAPVTQGLAGKGTVFR